MTNETEKPVQTFREGAIGVSIWRRRGKDGEYYEFTLSRSYKINEDQAGYAQTFREYNQEALVGVIDKAATFIREQGGAEGKQAA